VSKFRAKVWTSMGAAVVLGAGGLAACSGEGGDAGGEQGASAPASSGGEGEGEGGASSPAPPPATGGEGEGDGAAGEGEGGAAAGERGAQTAYGAVPEASRPALRTAQLEGFFRAAKAVGAAQGADAAAALAGQGLLEVYDPARAEFAALQLDEAALRRAAQSGEPAALDAAIRSLQTAQQRAGGDPAAVARGLTSLSTGLYREATASGLDPIEYQHAYAAALAAQALAARESGLSRAKGDIDRLARLWASPVAPENVAQAPTLQQVQAQASRVELALSGA
jgi:hypothetical protein